MEVEVKMLTLNKKICQHLHDTRFQVRHTASQTSKCEIITYINTKITHSCRQRDLVTKCL